MAGGEMPCGCPFAPNGGHLPGCHAPDVAAAVGDVDRATWKNHDRPYRSPATELDSGKRFLADVAAEVEKAVAKFGGQASEITGLALAEEVGEVNLAVALNAKAGAAIRKLLHIKEGKSGEDDLWLECVQTAAMAMRLATECADRAKWPGNKRGCGGSYEVGSGGHVPGTPGEGCAACDRDFGG